MCSAEVCLERLYDFTVMVCSLSIIMIIMIRLLIIKTTKIIGLTIIWPIIVVVDAVIVVVVVNVT